MNIQILHMVEGAKAATGLTVIIDVFRAFTVETYLMRNNAYRIYPVGDVKTAFDCKAADPENTLLCGEREGIMVEGFDFGNSPSQLENVDLTGKTVVHTTSAGTQGIANAKNADEILTGSLVNAAAIVEYIRKKNPENVSLVCMGLNCLRPIEEDTLCAEYIKAELEGTSLPNLQERISDLRNTSGAKFFDDTHPEFPERDFHLSVALNTCNFVLRLVKNPEGLDYVERIDVL